MRGAHILSSCSMAPHGVLPPVNCPPRGSRSCRPNCGRSHKRKQPQHFDHQKNEPKRNKPNCGRRFRQLLREKHADLEFESQHRKTRACDQTQKLLNDGISHPEKKETLHFMVSSFLFLMHFRDKAENIYTPALLRRAGPAFLHTNKFTNSAVSFETMLVQ